MAAENWRRGISHLGPCMALRQLVNPQQSSLPVPLALDTRLIVTEGHSSHVVRLK